MNAPDAGSIADPHPPSSRRAGAVLFFGFGAAVTMWCIWFISHLPGLSCPPWLAGAVLAAVLFSWCVKAGSNFGRGHAAVVGVGSGTLAGLINLLLLGSVLVYQPKEGAPRAGIEGLAPGALATAAGFLVASAAIGLLGGLVGASISRGRGRGGRGESGWLGPFGALTAISVIPLLLIGGMVTSTDSGMAVPGWPDSYGAMMYLFPKSLMANERVFLEHMHRLFGSLIGLMLIVMFVYTLAADRRGWVKAWACAPLILVLVQGLLGGLRVIHSDRAMALVHGIMGHVVFAVTVALAAFLSSAYRAGGPPREDTAARRLRVMTGLLLGAMLLQIALGAMYRHLGQKHPLYTHAVFSLVVVTLASMVGFRMAASAKGAPELTLLRRTGKALTHTVGFQFLLGLVTLWVVLAAPERGAPPTAGELASAPVVPLHEALIATAHQGLGALILALATLAAVWTRRFLRSPSGAPSRLAA